LVFTADDKQTAIASLVAARGKSGAEDWWRLDPETGPIRYPARWSKSVARL
jgi:hypothetical protein